MIEIFYFDGGLRKGNIDELEKLKVHKLWINIQNITKKEADLIKNTFNLHPLTIEDLINQNTRIKVEEFPSYLLCVFYGLQKSKKIEMVELDFVLGENFLITNHQKDIKTITDIKNDKEKLESLFLKGCDFIFHKLLDSEIDNYSPVLEFIDDKIEDIEEEVTKNTKPEMMTRILQLKRQIVRIKKMTLPQREKISFLAKNNYKFISRKAIPYFRDIYDHAIKVSDNIDNYREAIGNTYDAYMSAISNSMNEVMKVLSIIATIALPLTVVSGIYGTNFTNLPGSGYIYGFGAMILFMMLIIAGMIYYFKKKNWF